MVADTNDYNQTSNGANRVQQWRTLLNQGEPELKNVDAKIIQVAHWTMQ
ncbi:hypothetical protein [Paenibacillus ferrarius]|nr:hypothetical protein [Paenibacillus ferrarius]